ncbi:hypothetical protein ACH5RR_006153 [Cinchona calisaya]|uniref:Transposase MuDR plant domain-containing protein n=1 Tax=Cinchona calisaya TaxID=153742 RepID=A0ABD3ANE7_9GENT
MVPSSSDDDSWMKVLNNDCEDSTSDGRVSVSLSDKSDIDFSNYEENDEDEIVVDSEFEKELDPLKAALRSKMFTYNHKDDIEFEKRMLFNNVDTFRAALKDYVIQKGFPIQRLKNEKSRCTAKCGVEGCPWRIHASPVGDSTIFQIKTYNPQHTCVMDRKNPEATSDWIAKKLIAVLRDNTEMTNKSILADMRKYGVQPSKMQVWSSKRKALNEIEGIHFASYGKLPKDAELLRQSNPECIVQIHYDRPNIEVAPRFLRLFISFKAQKDGFLKRCKPFIGFDGCHLKGPYSGTLLTVVALDGNNSLFPLAFAMAECENKETWSWFFDFFELHFGPFDNHLPLTCMRDRQKGLNLAYEDGFPLADARHAFGEAVKCDHVTNNFTESFNAWVGDLRGKPILTLVEGLRRKFMKKMHKRFQKSCTWRSHLTPKIVDKLKLIADQSRRCERMMASEALFEVIDTNKHYIVNLS